MVATKQMKRNVEDDLRKLTHEELLSVAIEAAQVIGEWSRVANEITDRSPEAIHLFADPILLSAALRQRLQALGDRQPDPPVERPVEQAEQFGDGECDE